jgi:hypothetical protein
MSEALVVGGAPDDVLLWSVAALRSMGARITRYDIEALTLEARIVGRFGSALIRLHAVEQDRRHTRLVVDRERTSRLPAPGTTAALVRRLRRALARTSGTPSTRSEER